MTSPHPSEDKGLRPTGVVTNGEGKPTTAHLNLTVDMAGQVSAEVALRHRQSTNSFERRQQREAQS